MNIYAIGLSHKTAPIEIREKFFLTHLEQDLLLSELRSHPSIVEAFVISTCNRTEIFLNTLENFLPFNLIYKLITEIKKIPFNPNYQNAFYTYHDRQAIEHLLRVASGLESLVIGEKQILGQLKHSIERAMAKGMFQREFNILGNLAIRTGKKAQHETQISFGGSSISWAAINKAEEIFTSLEGKSVLIIGAGKMSDLAVAQLHSKKISELYLMNRTQCNAQLLVEKYGGQAVGFCDIKEILTKVDLCICSVGAPHFIIDSETVARIIPERNNKELLFIDISMPRNIDPAVATLKNVELFAIDDLNKVVDSNMKIRETAKTQVEIIIKNKLNDYFEKISRTSQSTFQIPTALIDSKD